MKFFTYKLWQALQGPKSQQAERAWQANAAKYRARFERLRPYLGQQSHGFFRSQGLHDGFVVGIEDEGERCIAFVVKIHDEEVRLEFRGVRRLSLDYHGFRAKPAALLEWGYEEFSRVGAKDLQLEVLFSSGATLLIQFRRLRILT